MIWKTKDALRSAGSCVIIECGGICDGPNRVDLNGRSSM
jgi:hypothetical protein